MNLIVNYPNYPKPSRKTLDQLRKERDQLNLEIFLKEVRIFARQCRLRRVVAYVRKIHPDIDRIDFAGISEYSVSRVVFKGMIATVPDRITVNFSFNPDFSIKFVQSKENKIVTTISLFDESELVYEIFQRVHKKVLEYALNWFACFPLLETYITASLKNDDVFWTAREMFYMTIGRMKNLPKDVRRLIWDLIIK